MKNVCTINNIPFAQDVFGDAEMKKYLPAHTYAAMRKARTHYTEVSAKDRAIYAQAIKKWALSKGVTHYTHWFIPLNGGTAQKMESLYSLDETGGATLKFGEKQLCAGEGDASSFPSGGLRRTFEARGIMQWDYTCYVFVRDGCLYIPCTFRSFGGEVLDKKSPLIASCKALNFQALRLLAQLGYRYDYVCSVVGAEQEYFLIDGNTFALRKDLVYTGATLFGAPPSKEQQFDRHYFAPIDNNVADFMKEVYERLWKLGIIAKTQHNEVAPRQCELAPCYTNANIAANNDQLVMLTLKSVAEKHNLVCLLHEKPFISVNGSGKHNNWSLLADGKINLLKSGDTAKLNARFMLMTAAIVKAVDDYGELLTASVCSHSNDCRLGGCEAPPQILSVFTGQPLLKAINCVCSGKWRCGKDALPYVGAVTDRNRTSPFAFTGNKFEFRSVGSSASIADVNTVLNAAVAESLRQFADELHGSSDVWKRAGEIIADTFSKHKRIIFNGNNYGAEWVAEAKNRNLKPVPTPDAIASITNAHNINLLERHGILNHKEAAALQQIKFTEYRNAVKTAATVAVETVRKQILPSVNCAIADATDTARKKIDGAIDAKCDEYLARKLNALYATCAKACAYLQRKLDALPTDKDVQNQAGYCHDVLLPAIAVLRKYVDKTETICPQNKWPVPTYGQILFGEK